MHPHICHIVTSGVFKLKRNTKDNFRRTGNIFSKIIRIIRSQRELATVNHFIYLINSLSVIRIIRVIIEPCIVVQIHFCQKHIDGIVVQLTHFYFCSTFPLYIRQLTDQEIPHLLGSCLFGQPSVFMFILRIQWDVAEQIE